MNPHEPITTTTQINVKALTEQKIVSYDGGKKYAHLVATEPKLAWFDFAENVYKLSDSIPSIITYCRGLCKFQEFLAQANKTKYAAKTITTLIDELKQPNANGLVYAVLNDFSTYCHSRKGYAPASTFIFVQSACRLLAFLEIEIDTKKFKNHVSMPKVKPLREEYPPNEEIRKIADCASFRIRTLIHTLCDYGFEPADIAQLKPKHFKFDEDPIRCKIDREKTGEPLEAFFSKQTADGIKQLIAVNKLEPDDYIFANDFTPFSTNSIRMRYNAAVEKSGLNKKTREGHKYGKYHLKIYKKRWFSIAIAIGVPDYIVQGMLGRKKYLDEYNAQPLEKRQEFARKILKAVNLYADKADKQEVINKAAEIIGIDPSALDETKLQAFKGLLSQFSKLPVEKLDQISKILQSGQ